MSSNRQIATAKLQSKMLCHYNNRTNNLQIIRVVNCRHTRLEKVVFPRERILFEATSAEQLEIFTRKAEEKGIAQIISCRELIVEGVCQDRILAATTTL